MKYTPFCEQLPKDFNVTEDFLENLAFDTLEENGFDTSSFTLKWNNRKSSYGLACKYPYPAHFEIELSRFHFVRMEDKREMVDTVLHEVAHLLAGIKNAHNNVWKSWCLKVGARPERCKMVTKNRPEDYKYAYYCQHGHGFQFGFSRKGKYKRSCSKCKPYYSEEHALKVVQNW